jgi:hypothetical protein
MTTTGSQKGNERPVRRDAPSHLFAVGQAVRLKSGFMIATAKAANTYRVTATLPQGEICPNTESATMTSCMNGW